MKDLYLLYRGPLGSCNYHCSYCPFAKHRSSEEELQADRAGLRRFLDWASEPKGFRLSVLFTPWGEALTRAWYPAALEELTGHGHVARAAVQTNLSARLDWVNELSSSARDKLAFWVTYHPSQVPLERFLARCGGLLEQGVRFSVGIVGTREARDAAEALRAALPSSVYVWVNAYKSEGPGYYDEELLRRLSAIDPLFPINNQRHRSLGEPCEAGRSAITVDGVGDVRRCHFIPEVLGNLYADSLESLLAPRACSNQTCGCHIGYVHLPKLGLRSRFGAGLMERIPVEYGG